MGRWVITRLAQSVITVLAVVTLTFGLVRLLPGGPADYIKAQLIQQQQNVNEERINRLVEVYTNVNPEKPILEAYVDYMVQIFQGNLGTSVYYQEPVASILSDAIPWTVFLMSISVTAMFGIGILLGALMAYFEGSTFDAVSSTAATMLMAIPYYLLAVLLVYYLGYVEGMFPTGGRVNSDLDPTLSVAFVRSALYHAILPVTAMVATGFGAPALQMRGNSIQVLGEDYLRVARLRGLADSTIALRYVGRNAVLPMYTNFLIYLGIYFGGAVILEQIFRYQGVGFFMFRAIDTRDYPLMMGSFMVLTFGVVAAILIADLTYGKIDPRAGEGGEREAY